jgi:secreted PhoX family phosphatase
MKDTKQHISRRKFLAYLGTGAAALAASSSGLGAFVGKAEAADIPEHLFQHKTAKIPGLFTQISQSSNDLLNVPAGYKTDLIAAYGDTINTKGDTYGYNNSFSCYFPIDKSNVSGLVWVNHQSTHPLWVEGESYNSRYTAEQMNKRLYNQGASVLQVYRDANGTWKLDSHSTYARRITGFDLIELAGYAKGAASVNKIHKVQGTFANTSGGKSLWNTVLFCEGGTNDTARDAGLNPNHYGWVVEANPFDAAIPLKKQTSLGRFHHQNIEMVLSKSGQLVVYMSDGAEIACIYKFVSKHKYDASKGINNSDLLKEGTLYAANLSSGTWVPLTIEAVKAALNDSNFNVPHSTRYLYEDLKEMFKEHADVYVHAKEAALILGATTTNSQGSIKINPIDHTVYVSHHNDLNQGNIHGHITQLFEHNNDPGSTGFQFETFFTGGIQNGISSPDQLQFDSSGNLWSTTDVASKQLNQGAWKGFKNNGMYVVSTAGSAKGKARQFASAPVEGELAGMSFTPDERTLFTTVMHPGELSTSSKVTSMWPHRFADTMPRPGLVAISGFHL